MYRFYKELILYITYSAFFICCQLFCCFWIQTNICSVRTTFVKVCLYLLQLYCILLVSAVWFCSGQNSSPLCNSSDLYICTTVWLHSDIQNCRDTEHWYHHLHVQIHCCSPQTHQELNTHTHTHTHTHTTHTHTHTHTHVI